MALPNSIDDYINTFPAGGFQNLFDEVLISVIEARCCTQSIDAKVNLLLA
jgi:hypothetical protein